MAEAEEDFSNLPLFGRDMITTQVPEPETYGMLLAGLVDGAVVLETVFNLPGIGLLMVSAVAARDAATVLGLVLGIGFFMMILILIIDLSYGVLDPRVKYE